MLSNYNLNYYCPKYFLFMWCLGAEIVTKIKMYVLPYVL